MSFGSITHHLMRARETALRHDSTSEAQRLAIEAVVFHIDFLLIVVRKIHHRIALGLDRREE